MMVPALANRRDGLPIPAIDPMFITQEKEIEMRYPNKLCAHMARLGFVSLAALSLSTEAATLSPFNDKSGFLAATGATSATGPLPTTVPTVLSLTAGTVTFTAGHTVTCAGPGTFSVGEGNARLPGNEIGLCNKENLNMDLASPVSALGFDFVEPRFDPNFVDSLFSVSFFSSGTLLGSFNFNAPNDTAYFVGASSDTTFNRVEIREIIGGIDNEFFGQVYTATSPATTPIPEPSTLWLLGTGLMGWGYSLSAKHRKMALRNT